MGTETVWRALPRKIKERMGQEGLVGVQEIRLRSGQPVFFRGESGLFSPPALEGLHTVGVVDERGEIAPLLDGVPQMDVGPCTDVLEGCPKAQGMQLLLRSMSPEIIAVDELGRAEDVFAVEEVLHAGVTLLATAHGADLADLRRRPHLRELAERQVFGRYLFLSCRKGAGTVEEIRGRDGTLLWKEGDGCG